MSSARSGTLRDMEPLTENELAYYGAVAQVVPVLLLAIAVEVRFTSWISGSGKVAAWANRLIIYAVFVLLFVAEILAVDALRQGKASSDASFWTMLAVVSAMLTLFLGVLTVTMRNLQRPAGSDRP